MVSRSRGHWFDFGLFFFHNAAALLGKGTGPYFICRSWRIISKARLWNDVFNFAQDELKIPRGSIRATVLIETILAPLRWTRFSTNCATIPRVSTAVDGITFSATFKKFHARPEFVLPDRSEVTMETHFLSSYVDLLIQTCHRRSIHAMGGMGSARFQFEMIRRRMIRLSKRCVVTNSAKVKAGHDGTWVAHPGLVGVAKEVFDKYMPEPNQISSHKSAGHAVSAKDLIEAPKGTITEQGLRWNIDVGMQYLHSWLGGLGLRSHL